MEYKLDRNVHSLLDPRTKLLLLFTSSVFVVGNAGEKRMVVFYWILVYLPVLLLFVEKEWKAGLISADNSAEHIHYQQHGAHPSRQHLCDRINILLSEILSC